jgi:hypothetical protein
MDSDTWKMAIWPTTCQQQALTDRWDRIIEVNPL